MLLENGLKNYGCSASSSACLVHSNHMFFTLATIKIATPVLSRGKADWANRRMRFFFHHFHLYPTRKVQIWCQKNSSASSSACLFQFKQKFDAEYVEIMITPRLPLSSPQGSASTEVVRLPAAAISLWLNLN